MALLPHTRRACLPTHTRLAAYAVTGTAPAPAEHVRSLTVRPTPTYTGHHNQVCRLPPAPNAKTRSLVQRAGAHTRSSRTSSRCEGGLQHAGSNGRVLGHEGCGGQQRAGAGDSSAAAGHHTQTLGGAARPHEACTRAPTQRRTHLLAARAHSAHTRAPAARSASMKVTAPVWPPGMLGTTDASMTRRPLTPHSPKSAADTTLPSVGAAPMRHVPARVSCVWVARGMKVEAGGRGGRGGGGRGRGGLLARALDGTNHTKTHAGQGAAGCRAPTCERVAAAGRLAHVRLQVTLRGHTSTRPALLLEVLAQRRLVCAS
jgi:hypothetical protein